MISWENTYSAVPQKYRTIDSGVLCDTPQVRESLRVKKRVAIGILNPTSCNMDLTVQPVVSIYFGIPARTTQDHFHEAIRIQNTSIWKPKQNEQDDRKRRA